MRVDFLEYHLEWLGGGGRIFFLFAFIIMSEVRKSKKNRQDVHLFNS